MSRLAKAFGEARSLLAKNLSWEEASKPLFKLFRGLSYHEGKALQDYLRPLMVRWPDRNHTVRFPQNLPKGWEDLSKEDLLVATQDSNVKHDPLLNLVNHYVCTSEGAVIYLSKFITAPPRVTWRHSDIRSPTKALSGFQTISHMTFMSKGRSPWGFRGQKWEQSVITTNHFLDLSLIQTICIQDSPITQTYFYNAPSWSSIKAWDLTAGVGHIPHKMLYGSALAEWFKVVCKDLECVYLPDDCLEDYALGGTLKAIHPHLEILTPGDLELKILADAETT